MTSSTHYGRALFEITEELGSTERTLGDINTVCALLDSSPEYVKLLDTPAVPKDERVRLISESLGELDEHLVNLIKILSEHHSVYLFKKIADEYLSLYDVSRGIERVEVISAVVLSDKQAERLTKKLENLCGKTVKLKCTVDPSILGGLKVRYAGRQLDGSIKTRLDSFKESLSNVII